MIEPWPPNSVNALACRLPTIEHCNRAGVSDVSAAEITLAIDISHVGVGSSSLVGWNQEDCPRSFKIPMLYTL